ncbi:MHYT domain-containing protein [Cellulosimicrobium composti]|uniref:MHYT domain-containing protein n=1 Tax=Cellulosimicrobium composti TaxID=2672572 RepID=UPI0018AC8EF0|nr:MHYT domain-containing protein [Cellulosimicrobium composti]
MTPLIAYLAAVVGSACGLSAVSRSRVDASWKVRSAWLWLGATAIGGTGIWVMHFVAMLGFTVDGMPIYYDVPLTVASAAVAVVVVSIGLHLVMMARYQLGRLVAGGVIAGLGVAGMHYMGMAAMRMNGEMHYSPVSVVLAVTIAVVAATVALWLCVHARGGTMLTVSALVMGVAVAGMHYTGMWGISVTGQTGAPDAGVPMIDLLGALLLGAGGTVLLLVFIVVGSRTESERRRYESFRERVADERVADAS